MHLIWLTPEFPNNKNNTKGIYIYRTVKELAKYYNITVIALYPAAPPLLEMFKHKRDWKKILIDWRLNYFANNSIQISNCNIIYLRYFRLPRKLFHDIEGWFAYFKIRKALKTIITKDSIIHANWIFPAGTLGKIISHKYKVPFLISLLGSDVNRLVEGSRFLKSAENLLSHANKVTAVTNDLFKKCFEKKIFINQEKRFLIDNFYETERFIIKEKKEVRKVLGIEEDQKVIFFAGNLITLKNVDILIKAFSFLEQINSKTKLFVAGTGTEESSLKKLVVDLNLSKKVNFLGTILADDLVNYYNAADVLSLQSKSEGLPNVIVESFLCGTPVVATNVGGIPQIVKEGVNGFLVQSNSIDDLAKKIDLSLKITWNRDNIRNSISEMFSQNVLEKYRILYDSMI